MVERGARRLPDPGIAFMLDVEQRYDRHQAARRRPRLEPLGMTWFEAPLLDSDLDGYVELRRQQHRADPGRRQHDPGAVSQLRPGASRMGAWSMARVDATIAGGITPTRKVMALAEAHHTSCELQCWGYTLTQAANLHLMRPTATAATSSSPRPIRRSSTARSTSSGPTARASSHARRGRASAMRVDWPAVERAAILRYAIGA